MRTATMRHSDVANLDWMQLPVDGGQIVDVTYAEDDGKLFCRSHDRSDNTTTITYQEIDDSADDDGLRFEPQNGILPETTGDNHPVYADDVADIMDVLESYGDRFAGNNAEDTANGWINDDINNPEVVGAWCEIGVWESSVAARMIEEKLTPAQVSAGAERLLEALGEDEDSADRYTDGSPIYSVCNGDTSIDDLIAAAKQD